MEIAEYFQVARNIPDVNMIAIDVPEMEQISPEQF